MKHFWPLRTYLSALADRARAHRRHVGAGVRLGEAERRELRCLGEHPEVLGLHRLRPGEADGRARQAVGAERRLDARAAPRELLLDDAAVEVGRLRAAVGLRHVGVHEPEPPRLLDDVLRPRAVPVVLRGDGADLLRGEVVRHLAQRLLLVGEGEVDHGLSVRKTDAIDWSVKRWTSAETYFMTHLSRFRWRGRARRSRSRPRWRPR